VIVLTLSLKALVSCLIEEPLHDGLFELDRVVDLEGIVALPRNDFVEASPYTFFQHHVKLPRKCRVATTCSFGQVFHVLFYVLMLYVCCVSSCFQNYEPIIFGRWWN
jgi:hypothetical protein